MRVTVHVNQEAAVKLRKHQHNTPQTREIAEVADDLGVAIEPMHPDVDDPDLAQYFIVQVPDSTAAEEVIKRLRNCEAVESAYIKPPEAMP